MTQLINAGIRLQILGSKVLSYKILPICNLSTYFSRLVYKAPKPCLPPSAFMAPTFILQTYTSWEQGLPMAWGPEQGHKSPPKVSLSLSDSKHSRLFVDTDHSFWNMADKRLGIKLYDYQCSVSVTNLLHVSLIHKRGKKKKML